MYNYVLINSDLPLLYNILQPSKMLDDTRLDKQLSFVQGLNNMNLDLVSWRAIQCRIVIQLPFHSYLGRVLLLFYLSYALVLFIFL